VTFPSGTYAQTGPTTTNSTEQYDPVSGRWLPYRFFPSPDRSQYVYSEPIQRGPNPPPTPAHVVDERTGRDTQLDPRLGPPRGWTANGIAFDGGKLTLLDPVSGQERTVVITNSGLESAITAHAVWLMHADTQTPPPAGVTQARETLVRVDLATGVQQAWFDSDAYFGPAAPESPAYSGQHTAYDNARHWAVIGFTEDEQPIIATGTRDPGTPRTFLVVANPGTDLTIWKGMSQQVDGLDPLSVQADHSGVWFAGFNGRGAGSVSWWSSSTQWRVVAHLTTTGTTDFSPEIAGSCA
jgi:hypothetical protein